LVESDIENNYIYIINLSTIWKNFVRYSLALLSFRLIF
jgi:hypothetical protein